MPRRDVRLKVGVAEHGIVREWLGEVFQQLCANLRAAFTGDGSEKSSHDDRASLRHEQRGRIRTRVVRRVDERVS